MRLCYLALGRFYGGFFVVGSVLLFPIFHRDVQKEEGHKKCDGRPPEGFGKAEGQQNTGGIEFFTSWLGFVALWGLTSIYGYIWIRFGYIPTLLA